MFSDGLMLPRLQMYLLTNNENKTIGIIFR